MLIQGIHHVCIKCRKDEIEKVKHFYGELLGLPILRSWGETELEGFMFETGDGLVEVFTNAENGLPQYQTFCLQNKRCGSMCENCP